MTHATLDTITLTDQPSVDSLVEGLEKWGIAVVPNMLPPDLLSGLNSEFDTMMTDPDLAAHRVDRDGEFLNLRIRPHALRDANLLSTFTLFSQPFMSEVGIRFFGSSDFEPNDEIFVSRSGPTTDAMMENPPFALHFDKRQVLKFFFYLTDTDERNGAMRVVPGTHNDNRALRKAEMDTGTPLNDISNVVEGRYGPSVSINGTAGTMFVFTTDVSHGHSGVQPGYERRSMRGHTHSHEMLKAMGYM